MRFAYVVASYLLFWVAFPFLCLHRKTRGGILQRLGFYGEGALPPANGHPRVWLHGASAGDLLALSPMIRQLRLRFKDCVIVLSTTTNTGFMMANERLLSQVDAVIYGPYDLRGATRRAVRAVSPDLLVLEYTEIWPNLISACKERGVRVALVNGRFSPAHLRKYRMLFSIIGNPLRDIDLFLMREDEEAERVLGLGAPLERVWVTGNTKFDALAPASLPAQDDAGLRNALGLPHRAPVLIAGSTHEGENILEPAAQGRPVLFGPHMENFHDSVQVLVGRGGIQVNDSDHLHRILSDLLARPETVASLGELAQAAVRQVSGASKRNVDHLERLLEPRRSASPTRAEDSREDDLRA